MPCILCADGGHEPYTANGGKSVAKNLRRPQLKPISYIIERLRLLQKSGATYLCGEYKWATPKEVAVFGKLVLVAGHQYGSWTPSLAILHDNVEYGIHILQAIEPFSGSNLSWEIWSHIPYFPNGRTTQHRFALDSNKG